MDIGGVFELLGYGLYAFSELAEVGPRQIVDDVADAMSSAIDQTASQEIRAIS
jgi:hypothetical protein